MRRLSPEAIAKRSETRERLGLHLSSDQVAEMLEMVRKGLRTEEVAKQWHVDKSTVLRHARERQVKVTAARKKYKPRDTTPKSRGG